ncbi:uncharacterized protein K452DRAFT_317647 [Aplosporella prunicola CBS 121167]|uniref:Uncharacterized protein n=1 Tax=Aplosporella prunicola CBS 121167 TaxID=1176127 RepID=A0A6A6BEX1_9PEZI|nr:uncharacterized protein K452DRAFT_317647 [Aplosporella prunicola CBS 121167]KAF2142700.1 hypothetical protein K452DRAFT_317647 [Aplosporella prunicola CBS 121167]
MHIGISPVLALATIVTGFVAAQAHGSFKQLEDHHSLNERAVPDVAVADVYPATDATEEGPPHVYTPQDPPPAELAKRANIEYIGHNGGYGKGVYMCTDKNWNGNCWHISLNARSCWNLGIGLDKKASSGGPDKGYICYFYKEANCKGDYRAFYKPGFSDFKGIDFNDKTRSVKCHNT